MPLDNTSYRDTFSVSVGDEQMGSGFTSPKQMTGPVSSTQMGSPLRKSWNARTDENTASRQMGGWSYSSQQMG